jgi:hypothetical protein
LAGAPLGNNNEVKGKRWASAIDRALSKRSKATGIEALDELAEKLLLLCDQDDLGALRELGDRLDGKPHQTTALENPDGTALFSVVERVIIESK